MKCCNYDERCPEWTVIKNYFIIVDDWNNITSLELKYVDQFLNGQLNYKNADGIQMYNVFKAGDDDKKFIYLTKKQLQTLFTQWLKYKKDNMHKFMVE